MTVDSPISTPLWQQCLNKLEAEFSRDFNTWIRPLQLGDTQDNKLLLLAPNQFVVEWVKQHFLPRINELVEEFSGGEILGAKLLIGNRKEVVSSVQEGTPILKKAASPVNSRLVKRQTNLQKRFAFENFVSGNSNQLALAAALQVAENPGDAYNPLVIYGGVGLGKTHLMHAIGNLILKNSSGLNVLYMHSEEFVTNMVNAIKSNQTNEFREYYRNSIDVLMVDDIQFFAGKDRSQEEFFHTFNSLFEGQRQVILTSDRYPKAITDMDERLKSRFNWGLTVAIEPPELETRVAILMSKATEYRDIELPYEVAFFIAKRIRSNVRELEGALKRVVASAHFTGKAITVDFAKDALKDLIAIQDKLVTIENIQKTVADYFKVKVADILAKRRSRSVAFPRQMAMALAKELTNHSLPEIGDAFGGRDHTTVIHACRKIKELLQTQDSVAKDYRNLMRILSS